VKDKKLRAPTRKTLREEVDAWLAGAREGRILNRHKQQYKPAVLRLYEGTLNKRVLPELGQRRLADIDQRRPTRAQGGTAWRGLLGLDD